MVGGVRFQRDSVFQDFIGSVTAAETRTRETPDADGADSGHARSGRDGSENGCGVAPRSRSRSHGVEPLSRAHAVARVASVLHAIVVYIDVTSNRSPRSISSRELRDREKRTRSRAHSEPSNGVSRSLTFRPDTSAHQPRGESDTRGEGRGATTTARASSPSHHRMARQPAAQPPSLRAHPSSPREREKKREESVLLTDTLPLSRLRGSHVAVSIHQPLPPSGVSHACMPASTGMSHACMPASASLSRPPHAPCRARGATSSFRLVFRLSFR